MHNVMHVLIYIFFVQALMFNHVSMPKSDHGVASVGACNGCLSRATLAY